MKHINCRAKILTFDEPRIMGIVNYTPDSFYKHSRNQDFTSVLQSVEKMMEEGVDIVDIGAFSTRPGASFVSEEEELTRIVPIIEKLRAYFPELIISVDTFRAKVAENTILAGASIINDVSGGIEPAIFNICAKNTVPYVLMHIKGEPTNMMNDVHYDSIKVDIYQYFERKISEITEQGQNDIIIDLGFGFSKTLVQNYELFAQIDHFKTLERPILVGISRKSMITNLLNIKTEEALNATTVLNTIALLKGTSILRVHDVKEARQVKVLVKELGL